MKRGFSLLELVISIVVMGIVFLSIPTIIMQNAKNNTSAIIQQSVMDTKTRMALILKAPWGCVKDLSLIGKPTPIFGSSTTDNFYTRNSIPESNRRTFSNKSGDDCLASTATSQGEKSISSFSDKDDSEGLKFTVSSEIPTYNRDNVVSATMKTKVDKKDMIGVTNNNIKVIEINTTAHTIPDTNIVLRAYSANIGDSPIIQTRSW
ncbi:prepilin-type N-terminal cleavage/methylation domain-containing protein [Campylobacter sp. RM16191]|uniref:prepilin-type N-terminal cleavage/methylation domain-containing protein n=1 Tax=Campylobacter sp. RM16191 TaxID=1705728 RepID=UPI001475C0A5|nr:prepilin-type N-terminal cleavage/methylation domain-containing protein [Campylobacter sp. RM16191]